MDYIIKDEKNVKHITASYTMKATDTFIRANSTDAAINLTLPPLAKALGRTYYIELQTAGANDLSPVCPDSPVNKSTIEALDLDADADHVLLFAAPTRWLVVTNGIA